MGDEPNGAEESVRRKVEAGTEGRETRAAPTPRGGSSGAGSNGDRDTGNMGGRCIGSEPARRFQCMKERGTAKEMTEGTRKAQS